MFDMTVGDNLLVPDLSAVPIPANTSCAYLVDSRTRYLVVDSPQNVQARYADPRKDFSQLYSF